MTYLVDSDIVIDGLFDRSGARQLIAELRRSGISISVISYLEVIEGIEAGRAPQRARAGLRTFMRGTRLFVISRPIAERAAASVAQAFKGERLDLQDGVRIDWADSWVSVRASNTEPILRIIAEGPDEAAARARIAQVRKTLPNLAG